MQQSTQYETLVFMHIQKCAGCSLREFLESHYPRRDCLRADLLYPGDPALKRPAPSYRFISGHNTLHDLRELLENPICLTMLREPVERILSLYHYWRSFDEEVVKERNLKGPKLAKTYPLAEFIERNEWEITSNIRNSQASQFFNGLREPVLLDQESFLRQATERLDRFFWVGLVERYDESVDILCHQMRWKSPKVLERKNVTEERIQKNQRSDAELSQQVDDHVRQKLEDMNRVDLALYHYAEQRHQNQLEEIYTNRDSQPAAPLKAPLLRNRIRRVLNPLKHSSKN